MVHLYINIWNSYRQFLGNDMLCNLTLLNVNVCYTNNCFIQMETQHRNGNCYVYSLFCIYSIFFDAREKYHQLFFHYRYYLKV